MTYLMDKEGILNLARELIEDYPDTLAGPDSYLLHLGDTYDVAEEVTRQSIAKYPNLKKELSIEEIALAGELHDIGRVFRKNQDFHELRGARFIENEGYQKISDSKEELKTVAQMIRSHFIVAEQYSDEKNADEIAEFGPLDPSKLIPSTWQEAIVVYSDLTNVQGERIGYEERIADIERRYAENQDFMRSFTKGKDRVLRICEKVQALSEGRLSENDIIRFFHFL